MSSTLQAYGGTAEWDAAKVHRKEEAAPERRLDPSDGLPYTKASFIQVVRGAVEWGSEEVWWL